MYNCQLFVRMCYNLFNCFCLSISNVIVLELIVSSYHYTIQLYKNNDDTMIVTSSTTAHSQQQQQK